MNTNDNPAVSLEGEVPIITSLMVDYMEGGDPLLIIPRVVVIDTDPMEMIIRYDMAHCHTHPIFVY